MINIEDITYKYKATIKLTENELKACSNLYSNHYGNYTQDSEYKPGQKVCFPVSMYKQYYQKKNFYVALAYDKTKLVGQAFYIRRVLPRNKVVYFIFQLVVDTDYRDHGIATNIMRSI